jgi:BirA family biotin operon repressor/biotin-[acetyl-CoA-carboxylase] ligase
MLSEHTVAEAGRAAGLSAPAGFVASTGSTNADLMAAADQGAPAWTVLVAGHQESGRGRRGRTWVDVPGSSLLVSVLLRPRLEAAEAPLVSLAAAVAMAESIESVAGVAVACKWPNDLQARAGGRKLAGILPEAKVEGGALRHVVVGLGVNLLETLADLPEDAAGTSVAMEGGRPDALSLLEDFLRRLHGPYDPDSKGFSGRIVAIYGERCATLGRRVRATLDGREPVEGRAEALGPAGDLLVRTAGGVVSVAFGEVQHLR